MKNVHISEISDLISSGTVVKKKRERAVVFNNGLFYKVWVPNWTQSKIVEYALNHGFYNEENLESLESLIHDESGPRGYIQRAGLSVDDGSSTKSWKTAIKNIDKKSLIKFIKNIMSLSIDIDGTYTDFSPSNVIIFNSKLNLIDLESFRSFDLVFDRKKQSFENFDLDAWWKPHETAKRDVDKYFRAYLSECLSLNLDFKIDSREAFVRAYELVDGLTV